MKPTQGVVKHRVQVSSNLSLYSLIIASLWLSFISLSHGAGTVQIISARASGSTPPAGGSGNSDLPVVSANGRYIVFASTANNLVINPNAGPISGRAPRPLQVFVRDRVAGTTTLASVNTAGLPAGADCFPDAISTNGQYVLFESAATDLVTGITNSLSNIFLRDVVNQQTLLISSSTNGAPGNGASHNAAMTPDAQFIAFSSTANNLVAGDTNSIADVFVHNLPAGTNTLVSGGFPPTGTFLQANAADSPDITPDGRYISYFLTTTNTSTTAIVTGDVFVFDSATGTTYWASTNAPSLFKSVYGTTNEVACNARLSANGQYVVFEACTNPAFISTPPYNRGLILRYNTQTGLTDLVATNAPVPGLAFSDINNIDITPDGRFIAFIAATNTGTAPANWISLWDGQSATTSLISQNRTGGISAGDIALWPRLDSTGRYVAFIAAAANLVANTVSGYNCYVRDTQAGTTTLVNVDANNLGTGVSALTPPSVCGDGHLIAFVAGDGNVVPNDDNNATDVFLRDLNAGTTELESAHDPAQADLSAGFTSGFSSIYPNYNGLFVAFTSEGALVAPDTNGLRDVYLRDMANGTNKLISVNTNGVAGSGISTEPSVDATGRYVVFSSVATDLIANDTNQSRDVFLRDTQAGTTTLVSRDVTGIGEGVGDSYTPTISSDGRFVLYLSNAKNLTTNTFGASTLNLFLRNLALGTNYALTLSGVGNSSLAANTDRVAYVDTTALKLYVWDGTSAKRIFTNAVSSQGALPSLSPDGQYIAWTDGISLHFANVTSNTVIGQIQGIYTSRVGAHFSANDRYLTYSIFGTSPTVYLLDLTAGTSSLLSYAYNNPSSPAGGTCDSPVISPDGRYIAYRTLATNSVPTDLNEVSDLMLYDRSNAVSTLITASAYGSRTANGRSMAPVFSADGKNIFFTSWADDLVAGDFNPDSDVYVLSLPGSIVTGGTNGITTGSPIAGLQIFLNANTGHQPAFTWPAAYGAAYVIQYKNDLTEPAWHNFDGNPNVIGSLGQANDPAPVVGNRFYRVIPGN